MKMKFLALGAKCGSRRPQGTARSGGGGQAVQGEQVGQSHHADSGSAVLQEVPAALEGTKLKGSHLYSRVMNSSRFKTARAAAVQVAANRGSRSESAPFASCFTDSGSSWRIALCWYKKTSEKTTFVRSGFPAQTELVDVVQAFFPAGRGLPERALRQKPGRFHEDGIVEQVQGLERRVGTLPPADGGTGIRSVEVDHLGIGSASPEEHVEAAAEAVRTRTGLPAGLAIGDRGDPIRLSRTDALAADSGIQHSSRPQRRIADQLGGKPQPVLPGQQDIFRIHLLQPPLDPRGLAVGGRRHQVAQHLLAAPVPAHELRGQPIQESRMGGLGSLGAEVLGSTHESTPEQFLPEPIRGDAGGQWIVLIHQPSGQLQPGWFLPVPEGRQPAGRAGPDLHSRDSIVSPQGDMGGARHGLNHIGPGHIGEGRFQLGQLPLQILQLLAQGLFLGVLRTGILEEIVGHPVVFPPGAARGARPQQLRSPVQLVENGAPENVVPVQMLPRILHCLQEHGFPSRLQPGNRDLAVVQKFFPLLAVARELFQVGFRFSPEGCIHLPALGLIEEGQELVVLLLAKGIVLVVVTLGAAQGQPQPDRAHGVGLVQCLLEPHLTSRHARFPILEAAAQESGGNPLFEARTGEEVPGNLLEGEAVEGQVAIQCLDHPLPPAPGVGTEQVLLVAVAVGVAGQVQPVPGPFLAVTGRCQEPVHQPLIGVGPVVLQESLHLFDAGQETRQVQTDPSDEGLLGGHGGRGQPFLLQPGPDQRVDRRTVPGSACLRQGLGPVDGAERPVLRLCWGNRIRVGPNRHLAGPGGSLVDPTGQHLDLIRTQGGRRQGHARAGVFTGQSPDQGTAAAVAQDQRGPRVAPFQRALPAVQTKAVQLLRGTVALDAVVLKEGPDFLGQRVRDRRGTGLCPETGPEQSENDENAGLEGHGNPAPIVHGRGGIGSRGDGAPRGDGSGYGDAGVIGRAQGEESPEAGGCPRSVFSASSPRTGETASPETPEALPSPPRPRS